jgi:hypothetical protein
LCNPLQAAKAPEKVLTIEDFPETIRGDLICVQKVMEKLHEVLAERTMHLQHMYDILRDFIFRGELDLKWKDEHIHQDAPFTLLLKDLKADLDVQSCLDTHFMVS